MNVQTSNNLKRFIGKVCSIISTSMNRNFNEVISREHFVIKITDITNEGVFGVHPYNDELFSFFNMSNVISIHQEYEIDPNNPEHQEMIQEFKNSGKELPVDIKTFGKINNDYGLNVLEKKSAPSCDKKGADNFVEIDYIEQLVKSAKEIDNAQNSYKSKKP